MPPKPKAKPRAKRGAAPVAYDENEEMAERRPLPERTAFSIEYPGYVNSVEKAIMTLGGPERVAQHATSEVDEEGPVELRFRYNDPASHPISGDKVATRNLLIKVTKRTRRLKSAAGEAVGPAEVVSESAEIVAVVDKTARFRKLADFQVIVPKGDPLVQISKALSKVDIDEAKRLCESGALDASLDATTGYIPAPSLDRNGWSGQFQLKDITRPLKAVAEDRKSPTSLFNGTIIKYESSTVPSQPTPKALEAVKDVPQELLQRARDILADTPVVSRNAMEVLIPLSERQGCRLVTIMPSMAYLMQTGAWRSCWIRLGYDPRKDDEAYKYQVVDMRRKSAQKTGGRLRVPRKSGGAQNQKQKQRQKQQQKEQPEQPAEEAAPKNVVDAECYIFDEDAARKDISGIFQMHHIQIPIIKRLLEYPDGRRKIPSHESGWLQPSLVKLIHAKIREVKRAYSDDPDITPDNLTIDYNALSRAIYVDRKAEKVEISNAATLREREISTTLGQSSQAVRERVDANVETLMRNLGELENRGAADANVYATDLDDIDIYSEGSGSDSESDAADDDD
ncbi:tau 95 subunit of transcription factor TFIIIC [Coemansia sp. RSA 2681]|nr:tau 95 subunit of transcription factor TFIIIC [Coemansia sp. RSA 2681]